MDEEGKRRCFSLFAFMLTALQFPHLMSFFAIIVHLCLSTKRPAVGFVAQPAPKAAAEITRQDTIMIFILFPRFSAAVVVHIFPNPGLFVLLFIPLLELLLSLSLPQSV